MIFGVMNILRESNLTRIIDDYHIRENSDVNYSFKYE